MTLNESPSEGQVSNDVQQLVARRLVGKPKVGGVDHAGFVSAAPLKVSRPRSLDDVFDFCLAVGTLGEHDGVVNVTTLNQALLCKISHFLQEHKRAAARDVLLEGPKVVQTGVLGSEDRAVVVHHDGDLELVFFEPGQPTFRRHPLRDN